MKTATKSYMLEDYQIIQQAVIECDETNLSIQPDFKHDRTIAKLAQENLVKFIKDNAANLDELEAIINELYEKFGLK